MLKKFIIFFLIFFLFSKAFAFIEDTGNQEKVDLVELEYDETGFSCPVSYTASCLENNRVKSCCSEFDEILVSCSQASDGTTAVECASFFCELSGDENNIFLKNTLTTNLPQIPTGNVEDTCLRKEGSVFNTVTSCEDSQDCYVLKNYCGDKTISSQKLECPYGCENGACLVPNCVISDISWEKENANNRENVNFIVNSQQCVDETFTFDIYRKRTFLADQKIASFEKTINSASNTFSWTAIYENTFLLEPKYEIRVQNKNDGGKVISDNVLQVRSDINWEKGFEFSFTPVKESGSFLNHVKTERFSLSSFNREIIGVKLSGENYGGYCCATVDDLFDVCITKSSYFNEVNTDIVLDLDETNRMSFRGWAKDLGPYDPTEFIFSELSGNFYITGDRENFENKNFYGYFLKPNLESFNPKGKDLFVRQWSITSLGKTQPNNCQIDFIFGDEIKTNLYVLQGNTLKTEIYSSSSYDLVIEGFEWRNLNYCLVESDKPCVWKSVATINGWQEFGEKLKKSVLVGENINKGGSYKFKLKQDSYISEEFTFQILDDTCSSTSCWKRDLIFGDPSCPTTGKDLSYFTDTPDRSKSWGKPCTEIGKSENDNTCLSGTDGWICTRYETPKDPNCTPTGPLVCEGNSEVRYDSCGEVYRTTSCEGAGGCISGSCDCSYYQNNLQKHVCSLTEEEYRNYGGCISFKNIMVLRVLETMCPNLCSQPNLPERVYDCSHLFS